MSRAFDYNFLVFFANTCNRGEKYVTKVRGVALTRIR